MQTVVRSKLKKPLIDILLFMYVCITIKSMKIMNNE